MRLSPGNERDSLFEILDLAAVKMNTKEAILQQMSSSVSTRSSEHQTVKETVGTDQDGHHSHLLELLDLDACERKLAQRGVRAPLTWRGSDPPELLLCACECNGLFEARGCIVRELGGGHGALK
jgi:hypothetical protein